MIKTYAEQNKMLKKHFGLTIKVPNKTAEGAYLVPAWNRVAKTYPEALQKALNAIERNRPFYNWRKGQVDDKHVRRLPNNPIPETIFGQMGTKWKGVSVENVRKQKAANEYLLGAYEVAVILLTHPDILKSYDDLWIDCPGDEWSYNGGGGFSESPCFWFHGDGVWFGARDVDVACDGYGSASGFAPQPLKTGTLDTVAPLNLESAIKMVKDEGYVIYKPI